MGISVNTNISGLIVKSNLSNSTNQLNLAIERMTTGSKLNHAKDNAANYGILTNLTTKINAYQVAEDNVKQGLDMLSIVSDSLSLVENNLSTLRSLSIQAQNGTNSSKTLSAMNIKASALLKDTDRIMQAAIYNDVKLFNTGSKEVTNAGKELQLNQQGFLEEVIERDTSTMTKLSNVDNSQVLAVGTYSISTAEELAQLAQMTNAGFISAGSEFVLANDIDLSAYSKWVPIGNDSTPFEGTFDGNGYKISNLKVTTGSWRNAGLFANVKNSNILNVKIENADINGFPSGFIVADARNSKFKNCTVLKSVIKGGWNVGGIFGKGGGNELTSCYVNADIHGYKAVGGIVGQGATSIVGCVFNGTISATCCAGISGDRQRIDGCASYGRIYGSEESAGIAAMGSVKNSFSNAEIVSNRISGGILIRAHTTAFFENNIFDGKISEVPKYGLLIGSHDGTLCSYTIKNCYYNSRGESNPKIIDNVPNVSSVFDIFQPTEYKLQVGINNSNSANINLSTYIGFSGLSKILNNGIDTPVAIDKIDDLIKQVTLKQTEVAANQNRLMSALDEISIKYENLVSTRSTLSDADIGKVSSSYIKMQILQNASATLLSVANQTPSIVLQLIK